MDGSTSTLREKWRRRTDAAFERMFADKSQEELVTFTEREDMAVLIAKEMAAFLLEEHLARDPLVRPAEAAAASCPKCGKAGERRMKKNEALPGRCVTTRAGEVELRRERWRCPSCRIIFFSARRSAETGDGRV
jgi:uncharacterized protein with PIN domain